MLPTGADLGPEIGVVPWAMKVIVQFGAETGDERVGLRVSDIQAGRARAGFRVAVNIEVGVLNSGNRPVGKSATMEFVAAIQACTILVAIGIAVGGGAEKGNVSIDRLLIEAEFGMSVDEPISLVVAGVGTEAISIDIGFAAEVVEIGRGVPVTKEKADSPVPIHPIIDSRGHINGGGTLMREVPSGILIGQDSVAAEETSPAVELLGGG